VIQISILKERNVNWGITISVLVTFVFYLIISLISFRVGYTVYVGYFLYADLEFLVGTIFGVIFALKYREPEQSILKYGTLVGLIGGFFSSLFITIYDVFITGVIGNINFVVFIVFFGFVALSGLVIGAIAGALISTFYMYKVMKGESEDEHLDDDFFDDLIEK
jgi:hypothetical protein